MKHLSLDDTLKQLNITQQPCRATWNHVLLQLCVSVIVLRHIKLLVNSLTPLQTAVLPLLSTKITQRFSSLANFLIWFVLLRFCCPQHVVGRSQCHCRTLVYRNIWQRVFYELILLSKKSTPLCHLICLSFSIFSSGYF